MCDEAVDNFLPALKFVPDWFVLNNMLEKRNVVFSNDDIDLDDSVTFLAIISALLLYTLITLTFILIILMKIILKLLFLLDLWLGVVDISSVKHMEK